MMLMMPTFFSEKDNEVDLKKYWYIHLCWPEGMFLMAHLIVSVLSFQGQATKQTKNWPQLHCTIVDICRLAASNYHSSF